MFVIAFWRQTDRLTDASYAISFITLAVFATLNSDRHWLHLFVLSLIIIWAVRLGGFLLYRINTTGKDARFDDMRDKFWKFLRFWILQALTVWLLMIPVIFLAQQHEHITSLVYLGSIIWLIGLLTESTADFQKLAFTQKPNNKGKWIDEGIWYFSRHPNYFGEILVWIGIYLVIMPSLSSMQALIALISPLFIITLLLFVSGVPILEKNADAKWGRDKNYQNYKRRTSILIPRPPKKSTL